VDRAFNKSEARNVTEARMDAVVTVKIRICILPKSV
jgi:hypothetical protein